SADGQNDPDILAINGASAALCVSDIPFAGPIGAVRVGRVNGEFVANPTHDQRVESDLDLVYVGTENDVIMIEGAANEIPEADFVKALEFAHTQTREMIRIQKELASQIAKPKREMPLLGVKPELLEIAYQIAGDRIEGALYTQGKVARSNAVEALREEAQHIDAYGGGEISKRFILHYNFPPFSVGETGRTGGASRREIGHGALAERSLEPVVPGETDFRYAIRISSEIMESNGSTS